MSEIEIIRKYIEDKISDLKSKIVENNDNIKRYEQLLEKVYNVVKQLDHDINSVNISDLEFVLSLFAPDVDVQDYIKKFNMAIKLSDFLYNPDIENDGIKKEMLFFIENISNQIRLFYNDIKKKYDSLKGQEQILLNAIEVQEGYIADILDNSSLDNCSSQRLDEFFDFLESSLLDRKTVFKLITTFTKIKLQSLEEKNKLAIKMLDKKISENSKKVVSQISESLTLDESLVTEIKDVDFSGILTEDEMEIFKKVETLIDKYRGEVTTVSVIAAIQLFNDFSLNTRASFYESGHSIDWSFIVADFDVNLLKYLPEHKTEILEIFKYILEQSDLVESIVKENEEAKDNFNKLKKELEDILEKETELFGSISFSDKDIEEYSWLISMINNYGIDECSYLNDRYPVYDIALFVIVHEIKDYLELLNIDVTNNSVDFIRNVSCLSEYIEKIKKYMELHNKEHVVTTPTGNNPVDNPEENNPTDDKKNDILTEHQITSLGTSLQYNVTKNLILLLPEGDGYKPMHDITSENTPDDFSIKENEFIKCLYIFSNDSIRNRKKERGMVDLECTTSSGKIKTIEEVYGFKGERLRFTNCGRTGYVLVPVHSINQKRLKKIYGDNLFDGFSSIPLVVGVIVCVAGHDYSSLTDSISHNCDYINNVIAAFGNPNVDIKVLTDLIENSMEECKKYVKNISNKRGR